MLNHFLFEEENKHNLQPNATASPVSCINSKNVPKLAIQEIRNKNAKIKI
jgi:hypothetical protein